MPVAVAEILKLVPGVWFGRIVAATCGRSGRIASHDRLDGVSIQRDVALQVDRVAEIASGREPDDAPTRGSRCLDGSVDGWRVQCLAVTLGSERSDVKISAGR